MLRTKSQGHWPFVPKNKILKGFLTYMGAVALTLKLIIAIVSLGLPYQVRIMTLASTVFKKLTFPKISNLNAIGSKFDLDFK